MTNCAFIGYFVRRLRQLSQRMCNKITYIRMCKFMIQKGKNLSLFQSSYIQLQSVVSSLTSRKYTVQAVPSKKKKSLKREKERGKERKNEMGKKRKRREKEKEKEKKKNLKRRERKREREEEKGERKGKRDGKGKRGRETEKEGEGEERRERERRGENRESDTRNVQPSPDAFPSTKLGNNITPKKGRLGKNITPISR